MDHQVTFHSDGIGECQRCYTRRGRVEVRGLHTSYLCVPCLVDLVEQGQHYEERIEAGYKMRLPVEG